MNIDEFYEHLKDLKLSLNTQKAYFNDISEFMKFLNSKSILINQINKEDIQDFFDQIKRRKLSSSSLIRKSAALRLYLNYLADKHNVPNLSKEINPTISFPLICSREQIKNVIRKYREKRGYEDLRICVISYLLLTQKLNINKLISLKTYDFCFHTNTLRLKQINRDLIIKMPQDFFEILKNYLTLNPHECNILFPIKIGTTIKPISHQAVRSILKNVFLPSEPQSLKIYTCRNIEPDIKQIYNSKHPRG